MIPSKDDTYVIGWKQILSNHLETAHIVTVDCDFRVDKPTPIRLFAAPIRRKGATYCEGGLRWHWLEFAVRSSCLPVRQAGGFLMSDQGRQRNPSGADPSQWLTIGAHSSSDTLRLTATKLRAKWLERYEFQIRRSENEQVFELQLRHR